MTDEQIKHLVDRFLGWKLPENFSPDGGVSFKRLENRHHHPEASPFYPMPTGTNLLDATQAGAMVRYILEGLPGCEVQTIELMARESDAEIARITGLLFDQINENKSLRAAQAPFDPVAWRCKDYADGWIYTSKLQEAQNYQATTGCLMQPLYAGPIALSSASRGTEAPQVQGPKQHGWPVGTRVCDCVTGEVEPGACHCERASSVPSTDAPGAA